MIGVSEMNSYKKYVALALVTVLLVFSPACSLLGTSSFGSDDPTRNISSNTRSSNSDAKEYNPEADSVIGRFPTATSHPPQPRTTEPDRELPTEQVP